MRWFRIRAWHIVKPGKDKAWCGQPVAGREVLNAMPMNDPSCESCLRYHAHARD